MRSLVGWVVGAAALVAPLAWGDPGGIHGAEPGKAPLSAGSRQELRTWAQAYWVWRDTGSWPAWSLTQKFAHPEEFPQNFALFDAETDFFGKVYQHRLQPDPGKAGYYTLDDLMRDDPDVRQAFREYTITGNAQVSGSDDAEAALNFLELAQAGLKDETVGNVEVHATFLQISGDTLKTDARVTVVGGGAVGDRASIAPGTPLPAPTGPGIPDCLRHWVDQSLLGNSCVASCLYTSDVDPTWYILFWGTGTPGFDCDDFADALTAWLLHHLRGMYPDIEISPLWFWFTDCNGTESGHGIVYVRIGDSYYLIEPQTGRIYGPYPVAGGPDPRPAVVPCGDSTPGIHYDPNKPVKWKLNPPNERPGSEPNPWWDNPAMKQKLIDCINQCFPGTNPNPDDYIWDPAKPGTPCTSNCGCDPAKVVMN